MTGDDSRLFGLGPDEQKLLAEQLRTARRTSGRAEPERRRSASVVVPEHYGQIKELPNYKNIRNQLQKAASLHGVEDSAQGGASVKGLGHPFVPLG